MAYTPLLSILLPVRIEDLAGQAAKVEWLAYATLIGAIAASVGGVLFGYLSDISRNRRGWIFGGLLLSCGMLIVIGQAKSFPQVIWAIIGWQLALNMMLAPLAALAADMVPDESKGLLGGLLAFSPAVGALAGAIVTQSQLTAFGARLALIALLVFVCVLPIVLQRSAPGETASQASSPLLQRHHPVMRMWLARLCLQLAEATMFAYLYFWLRSIDPLIGDHFVAQLFTGIMLLSAPLTLVAGAWSDFAKRPILPLRWSAWVAAFGLIGMAAAPNLPFAIGAYALSGLACAMFLALHAAQTLRILPQASRRGRDLGLFNLANTLPSIIMPWLVIALVPNHGYPALMLLLAILASFAALLMTIMPSPDAAPA